MYLPRYHDAELAERLRKADLDGALRCKTDAKRFFSDLGQAGDEDIAVRADSALPPQTSKFVGCY